MKHVFQDSCQHAVKVTFMKKIGYLISVFTNGVKNQTSVTKERIDIGPTIRGMLRMEDKCGNYSNMAHRSRLRYWEKQDKNK